MKRPLLLFSVSLAAGIACAHLSGSFIFIILSSLTLSFFAIILSNKFRELSYIFIVVVVLYTIGSCEYLYIQTVNTNKFIEFAEKDVVIKAVIDSEPDIRESKVVYTIKTNEIAVLGNIKKIKGKILFTTLKSSSGDILEYGREIEIKGRLNIAKGKRNPEGFDYNLQLAKSGISATIYANGDNVKAGQIESGNILVKTGLILRGRIVDVINRSLPKEQAGLLNGMLIGYREGLSKDVQGAFSDAGLTHIMAVSGSNIAFLVFPLVFLFKKLRLRRNLANIIIIGILISFIFITGFSPSVLRAVIMAMIILIGQMMMRETEVYTSIAFAAMLLLLYNPYTLFDIGFQLSFAATLSIVMFYKNIKEKLSVKFIPGFVVDILSATLAAQVGVLPISTFYFNKISLISIVSNMLVVPLSEAITILGTVMAVLGQINIVFSQLIGYINCTLLTFVLVVTKISASIPFATVQVVTPSILLILAYYVCVLYLLWFRKLFKFRINVKYVVAGLLVVFAVFIINTFLPKNMEVVFIDVGQGDSAFIKTCTGKKILIDGGGRSSELDKESDIGESVVVPFLLDQGVSKLDLVIATHDHEDHTQGLIAVLKDLGTDNLVIPDSTDENRFKSLLGLPGTQSLKVSKCHTGDIIKLDSKTFLKVLYPNEGYTPNISSLNNSSIVVKLFYKDVSILFTGDIEREAENTLLSEGADIKADVLKVAHHGSDTSTNPDFLKAVNPKAAVISVGKNNSFGHPSPIVVKRITDSKIQLFRTDIDGAVVLTSNGHQIKAERTVLVN